MLEPTTVNDTFAKHRPKTKKVSIQAGLAEGGSHEPQQKWINE